MIGVPLDTLRGNQFNGRVGASILTGLGHEDWIVEDQDHYIKIVTTLIRDHHARATWRKQAHARCTKTLRPGPGRYAAMMAQAYRQIWLDWLKRSAQICVGCTFCNQ